MYSVKLNHVLLVLIFQVSSCQRRIKDGEVVNADKKYVVYLLKARISPQFYDAWLCGGALVSPEFIVTSAACVTDVKHLYAVAGYKKYVNDEEMNKDPCTKEKKKKIILTCTPKAYELKYEELEKWSFIDIAVVKVESPYDLNDASYASVCSYTPEIIKINYETKFQEPGVDAIVLGWGHHDKWREQGDTNNYNEKELNYAPTLLQDKEECKKHYEVYTGMGDVIDKYMICSFEKGNINIEGETILKSPPTAQGCDMPTKKLKASKAVSCEVDNGGEEIVLIDSARRDGSNKTMNSTKTNSYSLNNDIYNNIIEPNGTSNYSLIDRIYKNVMNSKQRLPTRRQGICQNDHGGPLVTWVGAHEVLIGVASVFKITETFECIGPYLFTSTQCNGAFLDCILSSDEKKTMKMRRDICDSPPSEKGFELIEKHISWKDHPDGPAENERDDHHVTTTESGTVLKVNKSNTEGENHNVSTTEFTTVATNVSTTELTTVATNVSTTEFITVATTVSTTEFTTVATNVSTTVATTLNTTYDITTTNSIDNSTLASISLSSTIT